MKKIKDELVKKIYKSNLSQDELLFLFHIFQIGNNNCVANIHYKDVSNIIDCSIPNFYRVVNSLKDKGFITINKCSDCKQEITVTILNNSFNTKNKYKNYIDLNYKIFDIALLKNLKAGNIQLLLYFLFRIMKQKSRLFNTNFNQLKLKNIENICNSVGITKRMFD